MTIDTAVQTKNPEAFQVENGLRIFSLEANDRTAQLVQSLAEQIGKEGGQIAPEYLARTAVNAVKDLVRRENLGDSYEELIGAALPNMAKYIRAPGFEDAYRAHFK